MSNESTQGHASHTQTVETQGLPGVMHRPIKVVMLGAGSFFTPSILNDILRTPGEQGGELALVDIDAGRLEPMRKMVALMVERLGKADKWKVTATTERKEALPGAHYVVSSIEVSGLECVRIDNDLPAKYGINQCIGDTIGPGGLFKGFRTIPVFLEILKDMEALCPEALMLNYTNPMAMMCLAAFRSSRIQTVGLCHSVQGTSHLLAKRAGVPYEEMEWECAGINHLAWFTKLRHQGRDLYPELMEQARKGIEEGWEDPHNHPDFFRKDMMRHFGAFITESSGHLSEYLPYYRKRPALIEKYAGAGYHGETAYYADNWPKWRAEQDKDKKAYLSGEKELPEKRTWEYAAWIIEAREKNSPYRFHGNVYNCVPGQDGGSLITNLMADACVEVACLVDQNGVQPTRYGALPPQMAALCNSNLAVFDLGAQACIERDKEKAIHALMLDPLSAAVCSPAEIKALALEMFEAEKAFLPGWK